MMEYNVSMIQGEGDICIKSSEEFLNWFLVNNIFGKKIKLLNVSEEIRNMYAFLNYYKKIKEICEKEMNSFNDSFSDNENKYLDEAFKMFASSNKGGKYLRAMLVALGYHSFGFDDYLFLPLSMALEVFQTSILIHDDIIDMASKRRGFDTIPIKYQKKYINPSKSGNDFNNKKKQLSDSMALCLGDIGFYLANQIIVKNYSNNSNLADILFYYNEVAIKTCKGEMIDVMLPFYEQFYGEENLEDNIFEIYKLKTAWYSVVGPFVLGAILGGANDKNIKVLEKSLVNLGIAFQIKDDLLGIYGDEVKIGKSSSSDAEEFKQTLLYSYTVNTKYKTELLKLYGKKGITNNDILNLRDIFKKSGAFKYCNDVIDRLFNQSFDMIKKIDFISSEKKQILLGFAEFLKVRSK